MVKRRRNAEGGIDANAVRAATHAHLRRVVGEGCGKVSEGAGVMSDLKMSEKKLFEELFGMRTGYVMDFTNVTFTEFFSEHGIDIYSDRYAFNGDSKAKRLRAFWEVDSNDMVAHVLSELFCYWQNISAQPSSEVMETAKRCKLVTQRLSAKQPGHPSLKDLSRSAVEFNAEYLANQILRMEQSVESDTALAIGTAKELIETCCRTILEERRKPVQGTPDIPALIKATLKELALVPEGVPEATKGREIIKRLLSNLSTIVQGLAELRGLYGTGHGKEGRTLSLKPRHAKLAVGAAATLATFLFETHKEKAP